MLALGIRYLNGFAAASEPDARDRPEWPPHPARVFMALAAAHFQTGASPDERRALEWLESLPAPCLRAAGHVLRAVVTHYVPVNDKPGDRREPPTAVIQSIPQLARDRQPRTFARTWPDEDVVYLTWREVMPEEPVARALAQLCGKVTRIGHSMSLVQMWMATPEEAGEPTWIPDEERAEIHLRMPGPGLLADLERRFNQAEIEAYAALLAAAEDGDAKARRAAKRRLKEEFGGEAPPRLRPQVPFYQGYARPMGPEPPKEVPGTVFSPHLVVFRL
ncbi:MAG: type I-U CRISPR-associated protein Csb2, partial [Armatimonadota bacterium]|nr:type I-U CRISPR-associated protein Csb2 [Armatimonadota bacterium]